MWLIILSDQLPITGLVGFYPANYLIGRRPILKQFPSLTAKACALAAPCGISSPFGKLSPTSGQVAYVLRTRAPVTQSIATSSPSDLHVLSPPPAFVLSQDQTLQAILAIFSYFYLYVPSLSLKTR